MAVPSLLFLTLYSVVGLQWPLVKATAVPLASVGTFNTYLFRGAQGFEERKQTFATTLQTLPQRQVPDVLCLQELIRASDLLEVAAAARGKYPYQASFIDLSGGPPSDEKACTIEEISAIGACLQQSSCLGQTGEALLNCTLVECKEIILQTSRSCLLCAGSEAGSDLPTKLTQCATAIPASEYRDGYGLLLLSRYRLQDVSTVDYHPGEAILLPRGYISAKVASLDHTVLCTHLQGEINFRDYVGPPQFSSVADQQLDEVKKILEFVENKDRLILLGDFNHGPAAPGLHWKLPTIYGLMAARGLFSVNALWCGECTFCAQENPLAALSNLTAIIDHVYLPTNRISTVFHVRFFQDIRTPSGLPMSDHEGVRVTLLTGKGSRVRCPGSSVLGKHIEFIDLDDVDEQVEKLCPGH